MYLPFPLVLQCQCFVSHPERHQRIKVCSIDDQPSIALILSPPLPSLPSSSLFLPFSLLSLISTLFLPLHPSSSPLSFLSHFTIPSSHLSPLSSPFPVCSPSHSSPLFSLIATMLKAQDYQVVVGAMQMAAVLMQKLPDIFVIYFHREGVMHQMKTLRDVPLKMLATPKQEITTPPTTHSSTTSTAAAESSQTPTSTRK